MPQFVYTMKGLGKAYPPDVKVLEDIWLSFLPGAKIGVLGANGAGKSSLLRIMAGEDHQFLGEAFPAAGISVGFLQQEPRLDAGKTVLANVDVTTLSGGERRRVALCRLLLLSPDLLLLDEPTNHLDAESVAWLERFLKDYPGTVVGVTHDRYFLDNVAGWILELDRGHGIPWEGNYSSWLEQKQNRLAQEEKAETRKQRTLERELEWIRMSPRARQAKGKARLNAYEDLLQQDAAQKIETAEIYIAPGPRLGDIVVEARGVRKGYVDQSRDALDANKTVFEEITGGLDEIELGKRKIASRAYVSWFNFKGGNQQRKVGTLSGGERNRVHLAKLLKKGSNLLLLDEPTNDLDVDTLRS